MKYNEITQHLAGKTAIVYAQSDELHYIIKIMDEKNKQTDFVKDRHGRIRQFDSIEYAKDYIRKLKVHASFIALDNTYDEFGDESIESLHHHQDLRHDYMPLSLNKKD